MTNPVAFFDVDETLVNGKTMISFLSFFIHQKFPTKAKAIVHEYSEQIQLKAAQGLSREELNVFFYRLWRGFQQSELKEFASEWYFENRKSHKFFIQKTMDLLRRKKDEGYSIAIVSGSAFDILHEFIKEFGFSSYFFSQPEVKNSIYTGDLLDYPMIGKYKAHAVTTFLKENNIDAKICFAVGDDESDIPMLNSVGTSFIIKGNEFLPVSKIINCL